MKLSKRLTIKFLTYIGILMIFMLLFLAAIFYMSEYDVSKRKGKIEPSKILEETSNRTNFKNGAVSVSQLSLSAIEKENGWLQILDSSGREVYSFHVPSSIPKSYAPGELMYYRQSPKALRWQIYTWFKTDDANKFTWVLGMHYSGNTVAIMNNYKTWIIVTILSFTAAAIVALFFGIYLGTPVIHMLSWIEDISKGNYAEPKDKSGNPRSRNSEGGLKKPYKTFQEMIGAIETLSCSLKDRDEYKRKLDKAREEWIAGVSHDIKTPLSSVKGYADLLSSDRYEFSSQETKSFAKIIAGKSSYIEDLIEDLNLTFCLSSNALPIKKQPQDIVELVRRSVIDLINSDLSTNCTINFENTEAEHIIYPVDSKWFKRAIDNLISNAAVHNDDGTTITVHVKEAQDEFRYPSVMLTIKDDGRGMDEEMLKHIFNRYYRGTSTNDRAVKGSGLGTAIAKQLIEAHEGTISAESEKGEGTKFIISLPAKN